MSKPLAFFLSGPTGSGKSSLGVEAARALDGEIVNADSVQLYQGFDIGSGKVLEPERSSVRHHLLDIFEPKEKADVGQFVNLAEEAIQEILSRKKLPIVVGGSGLYIRSLLCGLIEDDTEGLEVARESLEKELAERSSGISENEFLFSKLRELDEESASNISPSDSARLKRAVLFAYSGGGTISQERKNHGNTKVLSYQPVLINILPDRETLYRKINLRVDRMLELGFLEEVQGLVSEFPDAPQLGSIGYKEVKGYLNGATTFEAALELMKRNSRRFAKRQYTWWRNQPERLGWQKLNFSHVLNCGNSSPTENSPKPVLELMRLINEGTSGVFDRALFDRDLLDTDLQIGDAGAGETKSQKNSVGLAEGFCEAIYYLNLEIGPF